MLAAGWPFDYLSANLTRVFVYVLAGFLAFRLSLLFFAASNVARNEAKRSGGKATARRGWDGRVRCGWVGWDGRGVKIGDWGLGDCW